MQHDRFAREIPAISAHSGAARSRRLMRNPFGGFSLGLLPLVPQDFRAIAS
jgi:hypothetical protein